LFGHFPYHLTRQIGHSVFGGGAQSLPVHRCGYWALDTADWSVEPDGGCAVITPPDASADLRITTCDFGGGLSPQLLLAWARQRVPVGTPISDVECGQFSVISYELVDAEGMYWREWLLTLAELVLLVSYCCETGNGERHRTVIERMLSTLADNRA
jgi:hypothetical protein